ncbi:MAG: DUF4881 domain-containing protein [Syntrophorhabdales bacterium]|jgi:hypothetical protein
MRKAYRRMFFLALVPLLFVLGCGEQGKVEQGRVIAFDKENRKVTLVLDSSPDPKKPEYTVLPPLTYQIPANPDEMGADPKAGYRMKLDTEKNEIVILDPASGSFKTIHYTQVNRKENVAKDDDLVFDRARKESRKFPVVDASKKTISIYSARQNLLLTFTVPDEYFSLPEKVWDAGDEVRIYCKERGKAARLMNISKIDIFQ